MSGGSVDDTDQTPIAQKVSDGDLLREIANVNDPVAKTSEIADALPIQQQSTKRRLDALEEDGYVISKKVGRGRVWWLNSDRSDLHVATNKTEEMERRLLILEERVAELEDDSGGLFG